MTHLTDTLIHKLILGETIGRHLTHLEGKHDDLVAYYNKISKEIWTDIDFSKYTEEQINEMRLEVINWCKDRLEGLK